jgi:hypothetical protein
MKFEVHCEQCRTHRPVEIEPITANDMTPVAWGDIVCKRCHFVIATMSAEEPGRLMFVAEADAAAVTMAGPVFLALAGPVVSLIKTLERAEAQDSGLLPVTIGVDANDLRALRAAIEGGGL